MKKLLIAFSMVGAGALIACATDNSVKPNYDSAEWFSASASGETITADGGEFKKNASSESTFKANEGKIEIDSELEDPVWFELDSENMKTTGLAKVTFELDASVVQESALPEELGEVKTAFALVASTDKTTTNFQAWVTGGWQTLADFTIPNVDDPYDLTMMFDDAKKVQFTVVVNNATNESAWLDYAGLSSKPQIDFVGCGKLKSMDADQVWIVSSEISFDGGKVTIAEKDADAMNGLVPPGGSLEAVLAAFVKDTKVGVTIDSACKLSTAEAYAIGLIANEGGAMVAKADGTFKVKADAQAKVDGGNIAVGFVTPLTPNDTTASVTYKLMGSQTGAADSYKTEIVAETTELSAIKIPTNKVGSGSGQCRYFKVVTTVTLKDAPAPTPEEL